MKMNLNIPKKISILNRSTLIDGHYYLVEIAKDCDCPIGTRFVILLCEGKIILFKDDKICIFYEISSFDKAFDNVYKVICDVTNKITVTVDVEE